MGRKPWDRPWKRREKAKAKRRWREDHGIVGTYLLDDVNADPDVLPPSATIVSPDHGSREITEADRRRAIVIEIMNSTSQVTITPGMFKAARRRRPRIRPRLHPVGLDCR